MAWTVFPTWAVGQVSLASDWNTYVAGNMQWLATPPILRAYRLTGMNTIAATGQIIPYDTVQEDTLLGYVVGTSLYTVPVAGEYFCAAGITVNAGTDVEYLTAYVTLTGSPAISSDGTFSAATALTAKAVGLVRCIVGDTLSGTYDAQSAWVCIVTSYATALHLVKVSN